MSYDEFKIFYLILKIYLDKLREFIVASTVVSMLDHLKPSKTGRNRTILFQILTNYTSTTEIFFPTNVELW